VYAFFSDSLVVAGWADDCPERAEGAVRVVQECELDGNDCRTFSGADRGALVALLQDNRDGGENVDGKAQAQLQDIRATMDKVATEVCL
jgi:hypothetical protein